MDGDVLGDGGSGGDHGVVYIDGPEDACGEIVREMV